MSAGKLYGPKVNFRVEKARIAAKLSGVEIDYSEDFKFGVDNKTPEFLSKFPMGQTPAFEAKEGSLKLTESNAIVLYLASLKENNPLLGKTKEELAKIHQYNFFTETQIVPHVLTIALPVWGFAPYNKDTEAAGYQKLTRGLDYIEKELEGKTYLVGDQVTVADIIFAGGISMGFSMMLDESYRAKYPNLTKYYTHYRAHDVVKVVSGEAKFADKPLVVQNKQ